MDGRFGRPHIYLIRLELDPGASDNDFLTPPSPSILGHCLFLNVH